eukprot:TRINITY_DN12365_c0_g2_i1.p1 TRINITY_DN12365_c0_g2~~TRINITY_DN12365_c0_g2_i1.p1  ORF type:complete len:368 (+),score=65.26 TRINITY_DN12365_c0_g2_i1:146-1105(+)
MAVGGQVLEAEVVYEDDSRGTKLVLCPSCGIPYSVPAHRPSSASSSSAPAVTAGGPASSALDRYTLTLLRQEVQRLEERFDRQSLSIQQKFTREPSRLASRSRRSAGLRDPSSLLRRNLSTPLSVPSTANSLSPAATGGLETDSKLGQSLTTSLTVVGGSNEDTNESGEEGEEADGGEEPELSSEWEKQRDQEQLELTTSIHDAVVRQVSLHCAEQGALLKRLKLSFLEIYHKLEEQKKQQAIEKRRVEFELARTRAQLYKLQHHSDDRHWSSDHPLPEHLGSELASERETLHKQLLASQQLQAQTHLSLNAFMRFLKI